MLTPFKRKAGEDLPPKQRKFNRLLASVRAKVEHPFRVLKRQFGFVKVRYRGMEKYRPDSDLVCAVDIVSGAARIADTGINPSCGRKIPGKPGELGRLRPGGAIVE